MPRSRLRQTCETKPREVRQRWPRKFGRDDKWNFGLMAASLANDPVETICTVPRQNYTLAFDQKLARPLSDGI